MKYIVKGSEAQVAAVDFGCNLTLARKVCRAAKFSNGKPALVAGNQVFKRKRDAELFKHRCDTALAYLSGKGRKWYPPTFVVEAI